MVTIVGEQSINLLGNHVKAVIFIAKYTIVSNFLKNHGCQFFFLIFVYFSDQNFQDPVSSEITQDSCASLSIKCFGTVKYDLTVLYLVI